MRQIRFLASVRLCLRWSLALTIRRAKVNDAANFHRRSHISTPHAPNDSRALSAINNPIEKRPELPVQRSTPILLSGIDGERASCATAGASSHAGRRPAMQ